MHDDHFDKPVTEELPGAGCLSKAQAESLVRVAGLGLGDPLMLSDQEGAGPIQDLEKKFAEICRAPYALALSSGTAAIHAALLALDVGPGDEVITTPYTWPSTIAPIYHVGATPVFADILPETAMLDPGAVEQCITPRTRGILTVHIFGQATGTRELCELAGSRNLWVAGDAAQLAPNCPAARELARLEDVMCFSLGRGKAVCAGEGGILVTQDPELLRRAVSWTQHPDRLLREFGSRRQQAPWSLNYRLHPLAAVLALADISSLESKMANRREAYKAFWGGLGQNEFILPNPPLKSRDIVPYGVPATFSEKACERREELLVRAFEKGIPLRHGPVGRPMHIWSGDDACRCPEAAKRCTDQELWIISPIDMDWLGASGSFLLGKGLKQIISNRSQ